MSAYKEIQTEFRSLNSLLDALHDLGFTDAMLQVAPDPKFATLPMYGYQGDQRPERAGVHIPREFVGSAANDVGFAWNGGCYVAIISEFDSSQNFTEERVNKLKQRYALHEVKKQAKMKGYSVQEVSQNDGSIRLVCVRR